MQREDALGMVGLNTYCETYGKMSKDVYLNENHEEFADWHVRVRFKKDDAKVLCCPEDMKCSRVGGKAHSKLDCCEDCVAKIILGWQTWLHFHLLLRGQPGLTKSEAATTQNLSES